VENTQQLPETVRISYKTGEYIGETVEREERRLLVKVLAVLKHPTQGDLHHPYEPDTPMFHERRALSYTEKVWVPVRESEPYGGAVPAYGDSLKQALEAELVRVDKLKRWAEQCIGNLESLRRDYRFS